MNSNKQFNDQTSTNSSYFPEKENINKLLEPLTKETWVPKSKMLQRASDDLELYSEFRFILFQKISLPLVERFNHSQNNTLNPISISAFTSICRDENEYMRNYEINSRITENLLMARNEIRPIFKALEKGEEGESIVADSISKLGDEYPIIQNLLLKSSNANTTANTSETDFCVITEKGIFVCEVKNIGNAHTRFIYTKDGQWTKEDLITGYREAAEKSPITQAIEHCLDIKALLKSHGIDKIDMIPVLILANKDVKLTNKTDSYIIRTGVDLYETIRLYKPETTLSKDEVTKTASILRENIIEENSFPMPAVNIELSDFELLCEEAGNIIKKENMKLSDAESNLIKNDPLPADIYPQVASLAEHYISETLDHALEIQVKPVSTTDYIEVSGCIEQRLIGPYYLKFFVTKKEKKEANVFNQIPDFIDDKIKVHTVNEHKNEYKIVFIGIEQIVSDIEVEAFKNMNIKLI